MTTHPLCTFPLVPNSKRPAGRWSLLERGQREPGGPETTAYGIALGSRSGDIIVVDVDVKGGVDGMLSLAELPPLPDTRIVRTPSGGRHYYLRAPGVGSRNGWRRGIDVKGEGGYVVAAGGRIGSGVYELIHDLPIADCPPEWLAILPSAGPRTAPAEHLRTEEVSDLREMLRRTAGSGRGAVWASWRAIAEGELPWTHEIAQREAGGVDSYVRISMMARLAHSPGWSVVSGAQMAELMRASLSLWRRVCPETSWSPGHVEAKWNAARAVAQAHASVEAVSPVSGLPWLVVHDRIYYVLDPSGPAYWHGTSLLAVYAMARRLWDGHEAAPPLHRETKAGLARITPASLIADRAEPVQDVVLSYTTTGPDIQEDTLILPTTPVRVSARMHADVHAWLQDLGGDVLLDWISILTRLDRAAPALWLLGAPGVGKSLLAHGLAQIWADAPSDIEEAAGTFNGGILECPLIFADERLPTTRRGEADLDMIKHLVTSTRHQVRRKYQSPATLRGALRLLIATNGLGGLRRTEIRDPGTLDALSERVLFVDALRSRVRPRDYAPPDRLQDVWLGERTIAEHALYLASTRTLPQPGRLLMDPPDHDVRTLLGSATDDHADLLWAVSRLILRGGGDTRRCDAYVWVRAGDVRDELDQEGGLPVSAVSVGRSLSALCGEPRRSFRLMGGPRKLRGVPIDLLMQWAEREGQPGPLRAALEGIER